MRCAPGQRCENARIYYHSSWERPSQYDPPGDDDDDGPGGGGPGGGSGGGGGGGPSDGPFAQPHRHGRIGARLANPLKPTIEELTPQQIAKARMVKASRIAYENDGDFAAAQQYLDDHGVPFDIDACLSSAESLVLTGDDGAVIAYRGTKIRRHQDVTADAAVAAGVAWRGDGAGGRGRDAGDEPRKGQRQGGERGGGRHDSRGRSVSGRVCGAGLRRGVGAAGGRAGGVDCG